MIQLSERARSKTQQVTPKRTKTVFQTFGRVPVKNSYKSQRPLQPLSARSASPTGPRVAAWASTVTVCSTADCWQSTARQQLVGSTESQLSAQRRRSSGSWRSARLITDLQTFCGSDRRSSHTSLSTLRRPSKGDGSPTWRTLVLWMKDSICWNYELDRIPKFTHENTTKLITNMLN